MSALTSIWRSLQRGTTWEFGSNVVVDGCIRACKRVRSAVATSAVVSWRICWFWDGFPLLPPIGLHTWAHFFCFSFYSLSPFFFTFFFLFLKNWTEIGKDGGPYMGSYPKRQKAQQNQPKHWKAEKWLLFCALIPWRSTPCPLVLQMSPPLVSSLRLRLRI